LSGHHRGRDGFFRSFPRWLGGNRQNARLYENFLHNLSFDDMRLTNVLIDLGGVLYEIDIEHTMQRYRALSGRRAESLSDQSQQPLTWFTQLDRGEIDIDTFARGLQQDLALDADLITIKQIWRELLIGVFPGRAEVLARLSRHYHLALLSNTSRYHHDHYRAACEPLFAHMDHLFFSFEMGLTKPDPAIYRQALAQAGWQAEETLFMDDSPGNLEAAQAEGIHPAWIDTPEAFDTWAHRLLTQAEKLA
jgi:HAD superfamily hydrolase (TIGR01509 family)